MHTLSLSSSTRKDLPPPPVGAAIGPPHIRWPLGHVGAEDLGPRRREGPVLVIVRFGVLVGVVSQRVSLSRNNVSHILSPTKLNTPSERR